MTKRIWLRGKKGAGQYAIVSDADYELIKDIPWYLNADGYAVRAVRGKGSALMHRFIMNPPRKYQIDHKNGNRLDNRRINLRLCDTRRNNRNMRPGARKGTSIYKGVHFCKERKKWIASVKGEDRRYVLGGFDDEKEAARAYDKKAQMLFGEFFRPNLPDELPR